MSHSDLVWRFAEYLDKARHVILVEPQIGPDSGAIPDVITFTKSYNFTVSAYEVKYSLSDLKGDLGRKKWEKYLQYTDKMYFVLGKEPAKAWKELLLNEPVGVFIENDSGGFNQVKNARLLKSRTPFNDRIWMSFLMHGKRMDDRSTSTRISRLEQEKRQYLEQEVHSLRYATNSKIRKLAGDLAQREERLDSIEKNAVAQVCKDMAKS